jgi:tight adherence protein B
MAPMALLAAVFAGLFVYLVFASLAARGLPRLARPAIPRPAAGTRSKGPGWAQQWLTQAGVDVTPIQFVAGSLLVGAVAFWILVSVTRLPGVAIVPALTLALLPRAWFGRRRSTRMRALQRSWPDGIRHLIAGIQSGLTVHQAIVDLAASGPEPLRIALNRFELNARMVGTQASLEMVKEQLADPTSDRVIEVLIVAHQRGGQIVIQILRELAASTVKDLRAAEEMETERLEQTINARAVFALPWFVLVLLTSTSDAFRDFYARRQGWLVIALGALMSMTGIMLVRHLSQDPGEERVFATGGGGPRP